MLESRMVVTPWGDSEKLRERQLSPGPGTSAEAVAENQRARISGAVVATVARLGYGAMRVAEVSELSGVSSRSFYQLFPGGKDECFLAVLGQIIDGTLTALETAGEGEDDWGRRLLLTYERFADLVAAQPATASLILTEAYAAGPEATKALDRATGAFERLSRRRLAESPERAGLPKEMIQAQVGALQELARTRLGRGEAEVLPRLVPELVELVAAYRPPPEELNQTTRKTAFEPDVVSSSEDAERAIRGFTLAVAEHGYAGATMQEIARHSAMSPNTFYSHFRDKEAALLATIDSSTALLTALASAAYRRSPGWASGVRAMIGSALNFLASRPATANILLAEIYAGGPEALSVRAQGMAELTNILDEGAFDEPAVPAIASEVISSGILALARRHFVRKGAEGLPSLTSIATYMALSPYIGSDDACAVANANNLQRPPSAKKSRLPKMPVKQMKWAINGLLGDRWATAAEIGDELGLSESEVTPELETLERDGYIERIEPPDPSRPTEWTNVKKFRVIDGEDWASLTLAERRGIILGMTETVRVDLDALLRSPTLGKRLDDHYVELMLELDEEGWSEMVGIHRAASNASQEVKERSQDRLRKSKEAPIFGRSIQLLFELLDDF